MDYVLCIHFPMLLSSILSATTGRCCCCYCCHRCATLLLLSLRGFVQYVCEAALLLWLPEYLSITGTVTPLCPIPYIYCYFCKTKVQTANAQIGGGSRKGPY